MSNFFDVAEADLRTVFLTDFAEKRTVLYDGSTFENIDVILNGVKNSGRRIRVSDHAQGLFAVTDILHCALSDLGGIHPERGAKILISEGSYFRAFRVASATCNVGKLRIELEAIEE